jgi:hypothetical protein
MSFVPTKLYCDSYFPNTETSLTMGNGHTQFAGLSDMTYSWVVDTSNNLVLNGQASGPSPAIQPIVINANGSVSIPSLDGSGGIPDNLNVSNLDVSGNILVDGYITNPTSGTVLFNDSVQANKYDFPPVASPSAPATLNWAQITLPANSGGNISSSTLQYNFLRSTSMIFCTYNSTGTVSSPPAVPLYVQQINVSAGTFVITGQSSATVAYAIFN